MGEEKSAMEQSWHRDPTSLTRLYELIYTDTLLEQLLERRLRMVQAHLVTGGMISPPQSFHRKLHSSPPKPTTAA